MRKWAFILYVLGMVLLLIFFMRGARDVESLEGFEINTRVEVSGKVVSERQIYLGTMLLTLDSGIQGVCECSESFEGRDVKIEGVVSEYNGAKQVTVERVWVFEK